VSDYFGIAFELLGWDGVVECPVHAVLLEVFGVCDEFENSLMQSISNA
jgi:hypothetical protein